MLIVKPVQDKKTQEEHCAACEAVYDADAMAYAAYVDEKLVGICQFTIKADGGHILDLCKAIGTDDDEAMFIMGRQTMNFIDLHGVHCAWFDGKADRNFILELGFSEKDGKYFVDLNGFFINPCSHKK